MSRKARVTRSLQLDVEMDQQLEKLLAAKGLTFTMFVRQVIAKEMEGLV